MNQPLDARWLKKVAQKIAETSPEFDWDRVETAVFQRLEREPAPRAPSSPAAYGRAVTAGLIAAAVAALTLSVSQTPRHDLSTALAGPTVHDAVPADIVATHEPQAFVHEQWARFHLHAPGRLRVLRMDDRVSLHLLEGKLEVDVSRRDALEAVTIRAGNVRVAVHGTLFSVELREGVVQTQVQQGSVVVGPASRGNTEGWLLIGPSTGYFDATIGQRVAGHSYVDQPLVLHRSETPSSPPVMVQPTQPQRDLSAPSPVASPKIRPPQPLPNALDDHLAATTLQAIRQNITACYRRHLPSSNEGVTIHAQIHISIHVAPDGHVTFARFDPPLSPRAQSCASEAVQNAAFPSARESSVLELSMQLSP